MRAFGKRSDAEKTDRDSSRNRDVFAIIPCAHNLLLPSAAKGLVKLDQGDKLVTPSSSQSQFCIEQVAISIKGVQQRVDAASIPYIGQSRSILEGRHKSFLFFPDLADFLILNESIRHFSECRLDHAFIVDQRKLLPSKRQLFIRTSSAACKNGLRDLGYELPHSRRTW